MISTDEEAAAQKYRTGKIDEDEFRHILRELCTDENDIIQIISDIHKEEK